MFNLIHTGGPYGDCCFTYDVELNREYTVGEFIRTVLREKPNEWGYIGIKKEFDRYAVFGDPNCEYSHGQVKRTNFSYEDLQQKIDFVKASGGWSRMDYKIRVWEGE